MPDRQLYETVIQFPRICGSAVPLWPRIGSGKLNLTRGSPSARCAAPGWPEWRFARLDHGPKTRTDRASPSVCNNRIVQELVRGHLAAKRPLLRCGASQAGPRCQSAVYVQVDNFRMGGYSPRTADQVASYRVLTDSNGGAPGERRVRSVRNAASVHHRLPPSRLHQSRPDTATGDTQRVWSGND